MKAYLLLIRPLNVIIAFLSVCVAAVIVDPAYSPDNLLNMLLAAVAAALICGGGNGVNDFFDIEIDRINKPNRPLPAGRLSRRNAMIFSVILFIAGTLLASQINLFCFGIAGFTAAGLFLYGYRLKRTVLAGNIAVGLFGGLTFVFGGLSVGRFYESLIPAAFAFLFHVGREIVKDLEDYTGDKARSVGTLAVEFGPLSSVVAATVVFSLLILATVPPYLMSIYGLAYFLVVLIGVDAFLVFVIVSVWRDRSSKHLSKISLALKIDMLLGLLAIYLG